MTLRYKGIIILGMTKAYYRRGPKSKYILDDFLVDPIGVTHGTHYLYGLLDVRDGQVRYVGQSRQLPKLRYSQHLWHYHCMDFVYWWREVLSEGSTVRMLIIDKTTKETALDDELALMRVALRNGHNLLNVKGIRPDVKLGRDTVISPLWRI